MENFINIYKRIFLITDYSFIIKFTVIISWIILYINDNRFIFKKIYTIGYKISFFFSNFDCLYIIKDTSLFMISDNEGLINTFYLSYMLIEDIIFQYYQYDLILILVVQLKNILLSDQFTNVCGAGCT